MRAPLIVVLLTIAFYWKISLTSQYVWFDHPDMAYLELPRLEFMAREIHAGRFPLWDPHIWMGQPLVGQTQPGPLNPLNVLFLLLPLVGAVADYGRRKREILGLLAYTGAAATIAMFWLDGTRYLAGCLLFLVANLAFGASIVIYNAFLPEIASAASAMTASTLSWSTS